MNLLESSDDEDVINYIEHLGRVRRPKINRRRPNNFENWDDHDFFVRYRLQKDTVRGVLNRITDMIANPTNLNSSLRPEEMLLLTLRFYATGSFLNAIGDLDGVHKSTASKTIRKVSHAIASLSSDYIRFPRSNDEMQEVIQGFYEIAAFPRVIGTIDCTHVKIQSPGGDNAEVYRNRKGYFSLNVQTVCDHRLRIRNIVCRWPGSAHDSHIFNNSSLRQEFERGSFGNNLLLGDSGYKNRNYLLTPLQHPNTRAENLYNEAHIRTRNCVERSYGVWKRRFPVLANGVRLAIQTIQSVVVATAVLHNIACDEGEEVPPVAADIEAAINAGNNVPQQHNYYNVPHNNRTRQNLITNYFDNMGN